MRCNGKNNPFKMMRYLHMRVLLLDYSILKLIRGLASTVLALYLFNTLWPSDTIWPHISCSASVRVAACCLTLRSHHLNECRLLVCEIMCHFIANAQGTVLYDTGRVLVWYIAAFRHHEYCILSMVFTLPAFTMKRSRHSRRMRNPQFYISGKRPIVTS